jgi:polyisoprenoid-binding protein YceI
MKFIRSSTVVLLALMATLIARAQQQTFTVDPTISNVAFALTGMGHEVHGVFHVSHGSIQFDRSTGHIAGSIVAPATSGDSNDKGRDKNMHAQVLNADQFADISFEPKSYQGTIAAAGDSNLQVSGIFTLHGVAHDLTLPMQIRIEGSALSAKGSFIVPYVKWGLKDPSIFVLKVAKEVHIDLSLSGSLQ